MLRKYAKIIILFILLYLPKEVIAIDIKGYVTTSDLLIASTLVWQFYIVDTSLA